MPAAPPEITHLSLEQADAAASGFASLSWRQAPSYGAYAAARIGASQERVLLRMAPGITAYADIRIKRLPGLPWGVALVSQGPVVATPDQYAAAVTLLTEEYVKRRRLVLRVEPPIFPGCAFDFDALFLSLAYRRTSGIHETFVIDLDPSMEELRRKLDGKWRTDLSRGERNAITIRRSTEPADFDRFAPLLDRLQAAKGFETAQDTAFFSNVARRQGKADHICIHLAEIEGEPVAGHVGAYSGDTAVYLLGAADALGRERRAAYCLQWAAMAYARERGLKWYDLGGIDEVTNPDVFRFKKRMGGRRISMPARYELGPGGLEEATVKLAERMLNVANKLRGRA